MATDVYIDLPQTGGGSGVSSLNSLTGALTLVGGTGISVTPSGSNITIASTGGSGTVTSVAQTVPSFFSVSGSPITTSGTLAITANTQAANLILSGPTSGSAATPTFKAPSQQIRITFDGGGSTLTGTPFAYFSSQFPGTIVGYTVLGDQSGSITITVKKTTFSGFPGSLADITGGNNIVVTAAQKSNNTTLTGWTTGVLAGDCFEFQVSGTVTNFQHVQLFVNIGGV